MFELKEIIMNRSKQIFPASGLVAMLASGALALTSLASAADTKAPNDTKMSGDMQMPSDMQMPQTAADYTAAAAKYDQEAAELESLAKRHAEMGALYRSRAIPGSKQQTQYFTLANHCENLASSYRKAAAEARMTAQSHRDMAKTGV
jgi:hypothetical protein